MEASVCYRLRYSARCLAPVVADQQHSEFLVGTCGLNHANQLHLLRVKHRGESESDNGGSAQLQVKGYAFEHPAGEVLHIAPSTLDPQYVTTVHPMSTTSTTTTTLTSAAAAALSVQRPYNIATLWRMSGPAFDDDESDGDGDDDSDDIDDEHSNEQAAAAAVVDPDNRIEEVMVLDDPICDGSVMQFAWDPANQPTVDVAGNIVCGWGGRAATVERQGIHIWDLHDSGSTYARISASILPRSLATSTVDKLNDDEVAEFSSFAWSSHEPQIATANGTGVHGWDLRTSSEAFYIDSAHHIGVRSVDYNAHKAFALVTSGDDGRIRFWDIRMCDRSIMDIQAHNHWATNVEYNRVHDQLVLSCGSDWKVSLHNTVSISSSAAAFAMSSSEDGSDIDEDEDDDDNDDGDDQNSRISGSQASQHATNNGGQSLRRPKSVRSAAVHTKASASINDNVTYDDENQSSVRSPVNRRRNVGIGKPTDGLVRDYVDHHESVYSARWSAADPWMFASVSYDGLVAINVVPEDERLRIMF